MKPASCKAKGRKLQQRVAADIIAAHNLSPDDVTSRSMGAGGCDILLSKLAREAFPYTIEVKNQESISIWSAFAQAVAHAEKEKLKPLLVFSRNRSDVLVTLRWKDFVGLP